MPQSTRFGASSSSVASVIAIRAGPRVHELTMPVQSLMRLVTAANAPSTEKASRARRVSVTQADSNPNRSIFCASSICLPVEGRSRKQNPTRSIPASPISCAPVGHGNFRLCFSLLAPKTVFYRSLLTLIASRDYSNSNSTMRLLTGATLAETDHSHPAENEVASWLARLGSRPLRGLLEEASALRKQGHGNVISFSPKVFIPLTQLCRDACGYCTFAKPPRAVAQAYLTPQDVLKIALEGAEAGCTEALFTLGDRPEQRYRAAENALADLGHATTIDYLVQMAALVQKKTGLLAHINAGVMSRQEMAALRPATVSQGIMLESTSDRLMRKGGAHFGCASKRPAVRIAMLESAGEEAIPFTTGILIGIGETLAERIETLLTIKNLSDRFGHIQEIIIQNFLPKPGTPMRHAVAPAFEDLLWTVAAARLVHGPAMHIQAPPNLSFERFGELIGAGIDDWGGVSPVTPDFVNPEAPWPAIERLRAETERFGCQLVPRLPVYPEYLGHQWIDSTVLPLVLQASDATGHARADRWSPGIGDLPMRSFP